MPTPEGRVDLPPAERAGILRLNPRTGRMEFRHPLIRSAVFEISSSRRIAGALTRSSPRRSADDPQRRAWHLGQSVSAPDEGRRRCFSRSSSNDLLHAGNSIRATAAMLRAAELSPARTDRARRVARAAYLGSLVIGQLQASPSPPRRGTAGCRRIFRRSPRSTAAAFHLLNGECDASSAQRLLIAALDAHPGPLDAADEATMEALQTLVFVGFYAGRAEFWDDARRQFARVAPELPRHVALLDGAFADPARSDASVTPDRLDAALDGLHFTSDPLRITRIATAGAYLDRIRPPATRSGGSIDDGRREAAPSRRRSKPCFSLRTTTTSPVDWDELEAGHGRWAPPLRGARIRADRCTRAIPSRASSTPRGVGLPRPTMPPRSCCSGRRRAACTPSPPTPPTSAACCSSRTAGSSRRTGMRHPSARPAPSNHSSRTPSGSSSTSSRPPPGLAEPAEAAAHVHAAEEAGLGERSVTTRAARGGVRSPH